MGEQEGAGYLIKISQARFCAERGRVSDVFLTRAVRIPRSVLIHGNEVSDEAKITDNSQITYSGYTSTDHLSLQGIVSSDDWWKISQMYLENHI